ncbi:MAG: hypothetical protein PUJ19_01790 [Campylobacteraceae bacterium]|nr:hypothetical protein [Campylobacteraceae bacterium]
MGFWLFSLVFEFWLLGFVTAARVFAYFLLIFCLFFVKFFVVFLLQA